MTEQIFQFGPDKGLLGILTQPSPLVASRPAIIVSNSGINHRVGPNRLWVELARRMASVGFSTLRFDLSGQGDSEPSADFGSDIDRATIDLQEAMDALQDRKVAHQFVVVGLCAGVDSVYAISKTDPRIKGAIFINGYSYITPSWKVGHYVQQLLSPSRWRRRLYRRLRKYRETINEMQEIGFQNSPSVIEFQRDLQDMLERKVRLIFVYSGGNAFFLSKKQFKEMTGISEEIISVSYYPMADHLFSSVRERSILFQELERWMQDGFSRNALA